MKKTAKLITVVTLFALVLSCFVIVPSSAYNANDWNMVTFPGKTANKAVIETTDNHGIRLSHEGHYPEDNAGLQFAESLDINAGIQLDVTIEEADPSSPDVWYGITLLNRPVYFNTNNKTEDDGFGIVLLVRPTAFQWFLLTGSGFPMWKSTIPTAKGSMSAYYEPNTNLIFDIKVEDGELHIYVDDEIVADSNGPLDFSKVLPYLEESCYVGFSMSETNGTRQSFVINGLNGQAAVTEGEIHGGNETEVEEETIDFDNVKEFTLADFTDVNYINRIVTPTDCTIEMDETEGCLKVTVTGPNPRFTVPMSRARWFDGLVFSILKMSYKTDYSGPSEFRFTTEQCPDEDLCTVEYDLDAASEFTVLELDMDDDNNGTWSASQVRSLSVCPMAAGSGESGKVFYFKSIVMSEYDDGEETQPASQETKEAATAAPTPVETEGNKTTEPAETKAENGKTTDKVTDPEPAPASNAWIWIVVGVVAAAAVALIVVLVLKKKKA